MARVEIPPVREDRGIGDHVLSPRSPAQMEVKLRFFFMREPTTAKLVILIGRLGGRVATLGPVRAVYSGCATK